MSKKTFRSRRWGKKLLTLSLIAFGIVLTISYISLYKLVFISNNRTFEGTPITIFATQKRNDLITCHHAEPFTCITSDNISIAGLTINRDAPKATILVCHGYRCCKETTANLVDIFPDYNIVLFDFRAHGENKKSITTIGYHEHKDVIAVSEWLQENKPELYKVPFIMLGISMGGAAALKATERIPNICNGLIVDSTFADLQSVLNKTFVNKSGLPAFPFFPIMKQMFNYVGSCDLARIRPIDSMKNIKKPILLIHSCIDTFIPVQESLLMYAHKQKKEAKPPMKAPPSVGIKLWIAPQCKHGRLHRAYPKQYKKKVEKFLRKQFLQRGAHSGRTVGNTKLLP